MELKTTPEHPVNSQAWWDDYFAGDWAANHTRKQTQHFTERLIANLPDEEQRYLRLGKPRVLDWGCAFGEGVQLLHQRFPGITAAGLDFSARAIAVAQGRHTGCEFIFSPAGEIPGRFDVILTSNCLEHFPNPLEIAARHIDSCISLYVVLVPYKEQYPLHNSHVIQFHDDSFPAKLGGFTRFHAEPISVDAKLWAGDQLLLLYGSEDYLERRHLLSAPPQEELAGDFNADLLTYFSALLPEGGRILEAGSSGGRHSLALARSGRFEIHVLHSNKVALACARSAFEREGLHAKFIEQDLLEIGQPNFDLVFSIGGIDRLTPERRAPALRAMASRSRRFAVASMAASLSGMGEAAEILSTVFRSAGLNFHGQAVLIGERNGLDVLLAGLGSVTLEPPAIPPPWTRPLADALVETFRQPQAAARTRVQELCLEKDRIARAPSVTIDRLRAEIEDAEQLRAVAIAKLRTEFHDTDELRASAIARLRAELQDAEELRAGVIAGIASYESHLAQKIQLYRDQKPWQLMLLARKAHVLLYSGGLKAKAALAMTLLRLLCRRRVDLRDADLSFPAVASHLPAQLFTPPSPLPEQLFTPPSPDGPVSPAEPPAASVEPAATSAGPPARMVEIPPQSKYDVIILAIIDFDFRFQRPQQIGCQLAKEGHRIWWISPSRFLPPESNQAYETVPLRENVWEIRLRGRSVNIYQDELGAGVKEELTASLRELYHDYNIAESCVIAQIPFWRQVGSALREEFDSRLIYDCMDDWSHFVNVGCFNPLEDTALARECDLLLVSGSELAKKFEQKGLKPILVRNAVDFDFFQSSGSKPLREGIVGPIVGFFGGIADWIDLDLIDSVARSRPQYSIVLIGEVFGRDISKLDELPNVHLLGNKDYVDLPAYLRSFDVCIIPFVLDDVTKAMDPVKLYEYLSLGKPVVSTHIEEVVQHGDMAYIATGADDFASKLDLALTETDPTLSERRREFAAMNTWRRRVAVFEEAVSLLFPLISILIVTYNSEEYIGLCLDAIRRNTASPRYEVIVVDNASQDGTVGILEEAARSQPGIRVIGLTQKIGFAAGNNRAAREARGETIVLLNPDTMVTPGWTERLLHPTRRDSSIGLISPVTNFAGNEVRINAGYRNRHGMEAFALEIAKQNRGQVLDIPVVPLFCTLIPRSVWNTVGELDESFRIGMFEDDDYSKRVRDAGFRIVTAEDCFVHHFGKASFAGLEPEKYKSVFEHNLQLFERKWKMTWVPHRSRPRIQPDCEIYRPADLSD